MSNGRCSDNLEIVEVSPASEFPIASGDYHDLPVETPGIDAPLHLALAAMGMSDGVIFDAAQIMRAPADPVQAQLLQLEQRLAAAEAVIAKLQERLTWKT